MSKLFKAIDLYSGIGGWTLGFKMAGVSIEASYEWWKDANRTHNMNFGTSHKETNIRELKLKDLPKTKIDFVIGSPPCTQFSLANRGGKGDIADGMIDIYKFLEVVAHYNPKYWAMENVPRVAGILEKEIEKGGLLYKFRDLFGDIKVYNASEFGVPQNRKRMIAGNLPFHLLDSYKDATPRKTMGDVLDALNKKTITDPVYGIKLINSEVTDHQLESPLTDEERRMNHDSKAFHPVYNKMSFPDDWNKPSRTVTSVCTRVSRESIVIKDHIGNFRRLSVRERGCIQSFPINYQFYSSSYGGKLKMIGNAVPPVLTFYIAQSMQGIKAKDLILPDTIEIPIITPKEQPIIHPPDTSGEKYSWNRSFWLALRGLRYGSGVRFELKNHHDKEERTTSWRINLFYGSSKQIKSKSLDYTLWDTLLQTIEELGQKGLENKIESLISFIEEIDPIGMQENWNNRNRSKIGPIDVMDKLSGMVTEIKMELIKSKKLNLVALFVQEELSNKDGSIDNKKLLENNIDVFIGILIGCIFNSIMEGQEVYFKDLMPA